VDTEEAVGFEERGQVYMTADEDWRGFVLTLLSLKNIEIYIDIRKNGTWITWK
jgi:hypothetical protein